MRREACEGRAAWGFALLFWGFAMRLRDGAEIEGREDADPGYLA